MAQAFIPFLGNSAARTSASSPKDFHVKVSTAEAPSRSGFQASGVGHQNSCATLEPKVLAKREGDKVTAIRVECPCGQIIEIKCSY